jgi:hypothetical protein
MLINLQYIHMFILRFLIIYCKRISKSLLTVKKLYTGPWYKLVILWESSTSRFRRDDEADL